MKLKSALSALAAAGLVVAPVAAQAGTSAAKSVVSANGLSAIGQRQSTKVSKDENLSGGILIALLLAAGAGGYGIYKAVDKNKDKSNGAA